MTTKEFNRLLTKRIESIINVLSSKASEYATTDDRLHNFKVAARFDGSTPKQALWGMLLKHIVSVYDIIKNNTSKITNELINEKIGDSINYLILLEAILKEDINENVKD